MRLPEAGAKRDAYVAQVEADGFHLLDALAAADAPSQAAALPIVALLRRVWARHFEWGEGADNGRARLRPTQGRGPGDRVESPYDADARFRAKSGTCWTGYMVHLTESCDEGRPRLVLHADTTPANVHEAVRTAPIHAALVAKGLAPSEHLVDSAYVSADHLITAREQHGIDLVGPSRPNLSWQNRVEGAFGAADFAVDWDRRVARCPEGKESASWTEQSKRPGQRASIRTQFRAADCRGCASRAHHRLAYALLLLALRHPGRALEPGEVPPAPMVGYVAQQVGADPATLPAHHLRPLTRREQLAELMRRGGFRTLNRAEARAVGAWLTSVAGSRRTPPELATALVEDLRCWRVLLPTPGVLERLIHEARARAERVVHRALTEGMNAAGMAALDELLVAEPDGGPSRLAWLRAAPTSPAARNLHGFLERLRAVRALGVERTRRAAVPPAAFDALAGEGLQMTAQHLRDLAPSRRTATLVATVMRLEEELTDAALLMFDKLMGALSRRAERGATEGAAGALRDAGVHLRLLARAGRAVIAAREDGTDAAEAVYPG